jgi:methylase of polypeptide subunit release factors
MKQLLGELSLSTTPKFIFHVDENVFPPDFGITTGLITKVATTQYSNCRTVMEMGCGTGFPAIQLAAASPKLEKLMLVDLLDEAVSCTKKNVNVNRHLFPSQCEVSVLKSDLFAEVPSEDRWDLIIHNQTFYPDNGRFGLTEEGGQQLTQRFLEAAKARLAPNGVILMAFASFVEEQHDPKPLAESLGYTVKVVGEKAARGGIRGFVYEIRSN